MIHLSAYNISSDAEIGRYRTLLQQIDPCNPYSRYELINPDSSRDHHLKFFLLTENDTPVVLMPFYYKPIHIGGTPTPYYDVSGPWGYAGPIVKKEHAKYLKEFWEKVDAWYRENNVVSEFIRFNFADNHRDYSGTVLHTLSNIRGRLLTEEEVWNNFKRSVRKNYRKAVSSNLEFKVFHQPIPKDKVHEFYTIWKGTMQRHEADDSYYHSLEYFENFVSENQDCCALALVYDEHGKPISTELLLLSNDTMFSFLGGTNAEYFHLRPNDLLKIEAMNWARNQGFEFYILGGGLSDGDSLYQYKKKFFPEEPEISFCTGRKILDPEVYDELSRRSGNDLGSESGMGDISEGFFPVYRKQTVHS